MEFKDHFSPVAGRYARARPRYPRELFEFLARQAGGKKAAWDCGTGNGQAAVGLAEQFNTVYATDLSCQQLSMATRHPKICYYVARESGSGLPDGSMDLVTAAQAAHWFDLEGFYREATRVVRRGGEPERVGLTAIWGYGLCRVTPAVDDLVKRFYRKTVGPYWPSERHHIESCYRQLPFPFREIEFPPFQMRCVWTLEELASYLRTWSAVRRFIAARGFDPVNRLVEELAPVWGDHQQARQVTWSLFGRVGRL